MKVFDLPPQHGLSWASGIRDAWEVIAECPYKDKDDGTCHHPRNLTPECHEGACPFVE